MVRTFIIVTACMLLCVVAPALAQQDPSASEEKLYENVLKQFAEAYNRQNADAMAALFTENGIRVTPNGILQGRDAIRHELQHMLAMGLHDYIVRRTVSHSEGNLIFDVGEWQAKVGDRQFHGYYSALLVREGDQAKISGRDRQRCRARSVAWLPTGSVCPWNVRARKANHADPHSVRWVPLLKESDIRFARI